jgi:hypothetical protein
MTRLLPPITALTVICLFACAGEKAKQSGDIKEVVISPEVSCPTCRIDLVKVATVDDEEGERAFQLRSFIFPGWGTGGWYHHTQRGDLYHLDSAGKYIGRLGRLGRGPGEMLEPLAILPARADSIYVIDMQLGMVNVFAGDGKFGRRFAAPVYGNASAALRDGRLVLGGETVGSRDLFVITDAEGKTVRAFRQSDAPQIPQGRNLAVNVATASDGSIWSVLLGKYLISKWDTTGKELLRLRAAMPWFHPDQGMLDASGHFSATVSATVNSIQEDSAGLLWVFSIVPDPNVEKKYPGKTWLRASITAGAQSDVYDYIIDVIDPVNGKLIAEKRVDQYLSLGLIAPRRTFSFEENEAGARRAVIWRLDLIGYRR